MKKFILILFWGCHKLAYTQTVISFSYDSSGNLTNRTVKPYCIIPPKPNITIDKDDKVTIIKDPNDNSFIISTPYFDNNSVSRASVYNTSGMLVEQKTINKESTRLEIPSISKNIYIIDVELGDYKSQWKVTQ